MSLEFSWGWLPYFRGLIGYPYCLRCLKPSWEPLCESCLNNVLTQRDIKVVDAGAFKLTLGEVYFDEVIWWSRYRAVGDIIRLYKYWHYIELSPLIIYMLMDSFRVYLEDKKIELVKSQYLVTIVPPYRAKLTPGFKPTDTIPTLRLAESIAKSSSLRLSSELVKRVRRTPPQASLPLKRRLNNLKGAFRVNKVKELRGKVIILVDDVITTGHTANEVSRALKSGGAEKVIVLTVARAGIW